MKSILFSAFTAFMLLIPTLSHAEMQQMDKMEKAEKEAHMASPKLIAVHFHADWCGSCKVLEPKLTEARKAAIQNKEEVLFVKFDYTDEATTHQSALLAESLSLSEYFAKNNGKTGYVGLFNADSKELVQKIKKDMSAEQISEAIKTSM